MDAVNGAKIILLCVFLYNSVTVTLSFTSVMCLAVFVGLSYIFEKPEKDNDSAPVSVPLCKTANPCLTPTQQYKMEKAVYQLMTYDAEHASAVSNFHHIQHHSQCIFAPKAKLWGAADCSPKTTLEDLVFRSLGSLLEFTVLSPYLGLDGFVFQLPKDFGQEIKVFGEAVRRVLTAISSHDPTGRHCMNDENIEKPGWVFTFNQCTMFVTTFAPLYPESHPHYSFGSPFCFILLQPEVSFMQHNLCPDSTITNWDQPRTVRDRIRIAFRTAGREYYIRPTLFYPMVHDIVRPMDQREYFFEWWKSSESYKMKEVKEN